MPLILPDKLPAVQTLQSENIFVMRSKRAKHQDIRPLKILILNLMPLKIKTEMHLLRTLSNSSLQTNVTLLHTESYIGKHTHISHLKNFYTTFSKIKNNKYDGMIITGAPVEQMHFEDVSYWSELCEVMDWSKRNVTSTLHICWGAQAGLYHHYGIKKHGTKAKVFGVFEHEVTDPKIPLVRGFDDKFFAPHSRHTEIKKKDIVAHKKLQLVSISKEAGVYIAMTKDGKQIFVTGHSEYDSHTLRDEYERDVAKGLQIDVPKNYYPDNNPKKEPVVTWRSHGSLLFTNWLNYYVYQETPYDINMVGKYKQKN